jgi:hypothetical protein
MCVEAHGKARPRLWQTVVCHSGQLKFTYILLVNCSVTFWTRNLLPKQIVKLSPTLLFYRELQTIAQYF